MVRAAEIPTKVNIITFNDLLSDQAEKKLKDNIITPMLQKHGKHVAGFSGSTIHSYCVEFLLSENESTNDR
jgi:hypothetical protein